MSGLNTRLTAALLTALSMALPLRAQIVKDPPKPSWTLTPSTTTASKEFPLSVVSLRYGCANTYANHKVVVGNGEIDLSFTSAINPAVLCPAVEKPYGPSFNIPALKTGKYLVRLNLLEPCHVQVPMCRMAVDQQDAGTLVVTNEEGIDYTFSPTSAAAGKDFTLNLQSLKFTCNLEYLRTAYRVQDGKITLTFLDKANPLIKCAPEPKLYGPSYRIAGLQAGTYEVWAERLPACVEQGCKILPVPELVGKFTVNGDLPVRKGWYLDSKEVKAGTPFSLNLVNNDYGNCNTSFDHTNLVVQENAISVSFTIVNNPEVVCLWDKRPHGPSFQMSPLKPGRYPVTVNVLPACLFTEPRCAIGLPAVIPAPSDTLLVAQPLALGGNVLRSTEGAFAAWRGQALEVLLPAEATGLWRAEVVSLSGKRLLSAPVDASRGAASLSLGKADRGVVMVRLTSPDHVMQTIRVPVGD